jgi:SOS response regulatory protein OraA/RecX
LKPSSRRKLVADLRKKHIDPDIIESAIGSEKDDERAALKATIERKRRQTKYQNDEKLMQYLARQGFNYQDIKEALRDD